MLAYGTVNVMPLTLSLPDTDLSVRNSPSPVPSPHSTYTQSPGTMPSYGAMRIVAPPGTMLGSSTSLPSASSTSGRASLALVDEGALGAMAFGEVMTVSTDYDRDGAKRNAARRERRAGIHQATRR
ncbi:hypothetical protein PTE30175_05101 [Pandoraea terrae]|uniref:Uncharacterized protein n=1 Tax=Pandoraea terrae TaxID=1537710 RepID=A0A5E4Z9J6_9BURK|nr:hypothetical protein PTE30175_05101 [Pandoraea terrae]